MAKLKNTGMIRVGNAVLKERNPACFSCKMHTVSCLQKNAS